MLVNTIKENLCVNKLVASKKEIIFLEGDMIIVERSIWIKRRR